MDCMKNRRSIRKYSDREVSDELLNELLEVGARGSNTGNMQLYSVVVTRDKANKEKLSPAHFNQPMVKQAPVVLTFCADVNRFVKWAECRDADAGFDNMQAFMASVIDAVIFAQTFAVAAEAKGLGLCYLGTTTYNADKIIDALSLPRLVIPIVTITLGYPAEPIPSQVERLPLEAVVHNESYSDYCAKRIDELYADKEALEVNKAFVRENNKQTLAQVFTDVRYKKDDFEHFSGVFMEVLRKQGFVH